MLFANVMDINASHETINTQIAEIKPPRMGVKYVDVARVQSPFLMLKEDKKRKKTKKKRRYKKQGTGGALTMESAINKNVKISGRWYKEGGKVSGYTIVKVTADEVLLKRNEKERTLYLQKKNDKIQFKVN